MRRREFLTLLGSAAVWPRTVRAQQLPIPTIGWIGIPSARRYTDRVAAFRGGLKEMGFVENQNVTIEYRWADDRNERLPNFAAEFVALQVAVIVTGGGTATAQAAKAATTTIPIVFTIGGDPVRAGLVRSLNRPEGNITGIVGFTDLTIVKRLELITEFVPNASVVGALVNPSNPNFEARTSDLRAAAGVLRRQIRIVEARSGAELENAFTRAVAQGVETLVIQNDPLFNSRSNQLAELAIRHRLPAIFENHEDTAAGGLISFGPSWRERYRLLGIYTGRILKGEMPANLPIVQPTKFELVINAKTAKALGLAVPASILMRADEVIE